MNIARTVDGFVEGMQNIERDILKEMRAAGITITTSDLQWNHGQAVLPIPESLLLEINAQGRTASAAMSREQIEDSYERVERIDVVLAIKSLVAGLTKK